MIEERGVHGLADGVIAAEREAQVRDAAAHLRPGAASLDLDNRVDECAREVVVLLDAGRDCEHVRVEDQVLRRPAVLRQQAIGALADLDLALLRICLSSFVERHHDDAGAVALDLPRLLEERVLSFLQRDRVDNAFAL